MLKRLREQRTKLLVLIGTAIVVFIVSAIIWPEQVQWGWGIVLLFVFAVVGSADALKKLRDYFRDDKPPTKTETHTHYHLPSTSQKPAPQTTPIPSAGASLYIPRGEVEDKLRAALRNHSTNALVGASGLGGVGKTELAKQLARELEAEREKSTLWVDLPGKSLEQVQTYMAVALGVDLPPDATKETRKQILGAAIQAQERTVFLDDVRLEFVADLRYCLPPSPPCAALVTSRVTELGLLPGAMHDLDVMDEPQSRALLRSFDGVPALLDAEPGADAGLIKACCFHPLALTLAAARLLEKQHFWPKPLAGLTAALQHRLDELQRSGLSGKDASLRANLDQSYQALEPEEQRCFRALAVFAPGGFGLAGAAAVWQLDEPAAEKMILRLRGLSLLRPVTGRPGRWRMHDLLRDYAEEQLRDCGEEAAANQRLAEYLIGLFDDHFVPKMPDDREIAWEQDNLATAARCALVAGDGPRLARLVTVPQNWLKVHFLNFTDWQAWLEAALRLPIGDDRLTAYVHKNLGHVQYRRNQYDAALASYARALALFKDMGDGLGEANTLQATGDVHRMRNQYDAALDSYAAALALFQEMGDRRGEANTLSSTGGMQYQRNQYDAALASYTRALEIYQEVGDRLGVANTLHSTGDVQSQRNQYDAALASHALALALYKDIGDWLGEANTLYSTGYVQYRLNQYDAALDSYARALALFKDMGDRLGEANTLRSNGDVQRMRNQDDEALDSYAAALALYKDVGDRQGEANTLQSTGHVQLQRNQYDAALASHARALALFKQVGDRQGEANTLQATGDVQRMCAQYAAALASYAAALALYQDIGNRQDEAYTLVSTGQVRLAQGNPAEADRLLAQAVALYTAIGDRYDIAASTGNYGWTLYDLGRKSAARPYFLRAAEAFAEIGMPEDAERARRAAAAAED